jgi:hypothetical protein
VPAKSRDLIWEQLSELRIIIEREITHSEVSTSNVLRFKRDGSRGPIFTVATGKVAPLHAMTV